MPDWFYRTVSRPVLNALPHAFSRGTVFRTMAGLADVPGGKSLIDFLGHMAPSGRLRTALRGRPLRGPLGTSCWFDGGGVAAAAWSRFGFGFLELGPCWPCPVTERSRFRVDLSVESPVIESGLAQFSISSMQARLRQCPSELAYLVRIMPGEAMSPRDAVSGLVEVALALGDAVVGFSIDLRLASDGWQREEWEVFWKCLIKDCDAIGNETCLSAESMVLVLETRFDPHEVQRANEWGIQHWIIESSHLESGNLVLSHEKTPELVSSVERLFTILETPTGSVLVQGGFIEPEEVAMVIEAGATGGLVDLGLMVSGPGFAKRANEYLVSQMESSQADTRRSPECPPVFRTSWFWAMMLGLGMLIGGFLALGIAATRVVLPYDEVFCGLTRSQIEQFNPRLIQFMAHDRVSLAGVMLAIAGLYLGFGYGGIKRGILWARTAVLASAGFGFASFFLFLGFGYFDPFHGFVTAIMFQLFLQCLINPLSQTECSAAVGPRETRAWRRGQWGQFLLVVHGVGLLAAGLVITSVGCLDVFVTTDLAFLGASKQGIAELSDRLIPLIAHDRVSMGATLVSAGIPYLYAALYGIGQGRRWVWWTLALSGYPAYLVTLGVHFTIGYTDGLHLFPVWMGIGLLSGGLALCYGWTTENEVGKTSLNG